MTAITFDTLKFAERLEKAGASRELASAMAEAQKESLAEVLDNTLATKTDINRLDTGIARLDSEVRLLKWMMGTTLALVTGGVMLLLRIAFALPH
jgi:hypothetical protein